MKNTLLGCASALALVTLSLPARAQEPAKSAPQIQETTITGCLNKGGAGQFVLTDQKSGTQTLVTGPAELESHAANHTVKLTGTMALDGNNVFQATKIEHIAATCQGQADTGKNK